MNSKKSTRLARAENPLSPMRRIDRTFFFGHRHTHTLSRLFEIRLIVNISQIQFQTCSSHVEWAPPPFFDVYKYPIMPLICDPMSKMALILSKIHSYSNVFSNCFLHWSIQRNVYLDYRFYHVCIWNCDCSGWLCAKLWR